MSEAVTIDTIKNILTKNVNKEYSLSREEAIAIMNLPEDDMPLLMEMAGSLRKKYKGNHVSYQEKGRQIGIQFIYCSRIKLC